MLRGRFTLVALAAAVPQVAMAADHPADRAAIVHILDDEGAAWAAGDAEAFAAHVAPDVSFTNTVGMFSIGKAPFVAQHRHIFDTLYKGSHVRQFIVSITYATDDVAIVDTVTRLAGYVRLPDGASPIDGALLTRLEQVMVRRAGQWSVASFHNVPIQPPFVTDELKRTLAGPGH